MDWAESNEYWTYIHQRQLNANVGRYVLDVLAMSTFSGDSMSVLCLRLVALPPIIQQNL